MKHQLHVENTLTNEAGEKGWFRKKLMFQSFSSNDILDFPELTEKDLRLVPQCVLRFVHIVDARTF